MHAQYILNIMLPSLTYQHLLKSNFNVGSSRTASKQQQNVF